MPYVGHALFNLSDLSTFLENRTRRIRELIDRLESEGSTGEGRIADAAESELRVSPIEINYDAVKKDVSSVTVDIPNNFGETTKIDGARATRSYPFTGDSNLFELKPSSFGSIVPHGIVKENLIVIGIEGRPDRDMLKRELDQQEEALKFYIEGQARDVANFNAALRDRVTSVLASLRVHREIIAKLKDI